MSTFSRFTNFLTNKDGELEKQEIYKVDKVLSGVWKAVLGSKTSEQPLTDNENSELDNHKLFFWVDDVPDICEAEQDLFQRGAETPSSCVTINLSFFWRLTP